MKRLLLLIPLVSLLAFSPSCSILKPQSPVTWEATRYLSFRDCWTVTHAAYQAMKDRQALGLVSAADAADIDKAWNTFRSSFLVALEVAQWDKESFTPENVRELADDLLTLIAAL